MTTCFEKSCAFRFTVCVLHGRLSICVCVSFPIGVKGRMWDLITLIPDHCLPFYF